MIHFISFGQSGYYYDIADDLLNNLKRAYPLAKTMVYNETHLPYKYNDYALKFKRGYGFWRWKPYVIYDYLLSVAEGDIVAYFDGRCHFDSQKIEWLDLFKFEDNYDFCLWQTVYKEFKWTTFQVFNFFNVGLDSYIANSGQIAATFVVIRKNNKSLNLIKNWMSILRDEPELFSDYYESFPQREDFIENRHDQTALSILVKLYRGNILFLNDFDVYKKKNSLHIQLKGHDSRYAKLRNNIIAYLIKFRIIFPILYRVDYFIFNKILKLRNLQK